MAELADIHVERDVGRRRMIDERERRARVDEPTDQPGRRQSIDTALERLVIGVASSLKGGDESVAFMAVEGVCGEYRGFPAERNDFSPDPFEILAALIRVRQNVHGIPRRDGADLSETAPDL